MEHIIEKISVPIACRTSVVWSVEIHINAFITPKVSNSSKNTFIYVYFTIAQQFFVYV